MKVLLIDDHPLIVSALEALLRGLQRDIDVTTAACGRTGREALRKNPDIDLVLLDLHLGDDDGFELLAEFRAAHPSVPVVVISASECTRDIIRAIDLGAMGFVPKRASRSSVLSALEQIIQGGVFVPPMSLDADPSSPPRSSPRRAERRAWRHHDLPHDLPDGGPHFALHAEPHSPEVGHARPMASVASLGMTPRQTDVLTLLLKGLSNKLIARELDVSVETVKDHVAAVLRTLKVSSRTQAVIAVSQMLQQKGRESGALRSPWTVSAE